MSDYADFFLGSRSSIVQLELLEISHPSFSKTYRIVRNATAGVTANIDGAYQVFAYYPVKLDLLATRDNLDFGIRVTLGDLGDIIPGELDRIASAASSSTRPVVRYWAFRSDDLSAPMFGPIILEIVSVSMAREGSSFEAKAPALNANRTGEIYALDRFPSLKALVR